jgi:hypothetical protein
LRKRAGTGTVVAITPEEAVRLIVSDGFTQANAYRWGFLGFMVQGAGKLYFVLPSADRYGRLFAGAVVESDGPPGQHGVSRICAIARSPAILDSAAFAFCLTSSALQPPSEPGLFFLVLGLAAWVFGRQFLARRAPLEAELAQFVERASSRPGGTPGAPDVAAMLGLSDARAEGHPINAPTDNQG